MDPAQNQNKPDDLTAIPSVDVNAPLKIEAAITKEAVPTVAKDAPLKIEEVANKPAAPEESSQKSNKKILIMGAIGLGAIVLIIALFGIVSSNLDREKEEPKVAQIVTPSPSPSPIPALDRAAISFEVLNGSGIAGVAKKAADKLTDLGYEVIKVDNADKSDYKGNKLFVSKTFADKVSLIIEDIGTDFVIASNSGELTDSTASARIIIGKDWFYKDKVIGCTAA